MTSRREFLASTLTVPVLAELPANLPEPLHEFDYSDVVLAPGLAQTQLDQTQSVLLQLNEDSLLKPYRLRAGLPAPGPELGGWYDETPLRKTESGGHGFAPGHCFGQWLSALARGYASGSGAASRVKLERLLGLYEPAISGRFYANFRFPAYNYDKLVIGLLDAYQFAQLPQALPLLHRTTDAAEPHLPPTALDRDEPQRQWRKSIGESTADDYTWDESYTLPENLFLAYKRGGGDRYRQLASRFLLDRTYFDPLSEGKNILPRHHAYSFCNALSSSMQAYLVNGSRKHLRAASNAFDMISAAQTFATGGWGPNESFEAPESAPLWKSLTETHRSFETPCGSYAHFKLTRYLLRVRPHGKYGDSMERVFYNTVLGAKPLETDGRAFYYSDYHQSSQKTYHPDRWPCCSGTLPQVAADYRKLIYFRDNAGLFVNLYLPSQLRFIAPDGAQVQLAQSGGYPIEADIEMKLECSKPSTFALRLRIPHWAQNANTSVRINGTQAPLNLANGFARLKRTWKSGDVIRLVLDMQMRLESVDDKHPGVVALVRGPLVLFAIGTSESPVARKQLLAARRHPGEQVWETQTSNGRLRFKPFTAISDERYSTYLKVS